MPYGALPIFAEQNIATFNWTYNLLHAFKKLIFDYYLDNNEQIE